MNLQDSKLKNVLKMIKSPDFIYLCVIFLFFITVVILFFYSTNFILTNINSIFSPTEEADSRVLNLTKYSLVVKKLSLPVNVISDNTTTPDITPEPVPETTTPAVVPPASPATTAPATPAPAETTTATTPPAVEPAPAPVLDKKSITINILNSTSKKGVAAALAKTLEAAGFATATTGNEKKSYALTTIMVKDEKKEYAPLLLEAVQKIYGGAVTSIITGQADFDATIIIGKK